MYQVQRSIWFKPGRLDTWWKNLENGPLDNKVWRLPIVEKSVLLLDKISQYIAPNPLSRGMRAIPANKKLEVTLLSGGYSRNENESKLVQNTSINSL